MPTQADEPIRVDDVRLAMVSLTDRLADQTRDQARVLIAAAPHEVPDLEAEMHISWPGRWRSRSTRPRNRCARPGKEVSQGLETVAGSARRAFDYFVKELEPAVRRPELSHSSKCFTWASGVVGIKAPL